METGNEIVPVNVVKMGMELVVLKDGQKYADATVLLVREPRCEDGLLSVTLSMTNDKGQKCTDEFAFCTADPEAPWHYVHPNNFYGSGLGGPRAYLTDDGYSFVPKI